VRACQRRLRAARGAFDAHLEPHLRPAGRPTP
jgi:hypothetical protein